MTDVAAPPPPAPPAPVHSYTVEARYVPKSVTVTEQADGSFTVAIQSKSVGAYFAMLLGIPFFFFVLPIIAFVGGGSGALLLLLLYIGFVIFLMVKGAPPLTVSRAGVSVEGKLYVIGDAQDFRAGADDAWFIQLYEKFGLSPLALQYGIYAVKLPYLLPKLEAAKVASYLTKRFKHLVQDLGRERERKIQQAQEF